MLFLLPKYFFMKCLIPQKTQFEDEFYALLYVYSTIPTYFLSFRTLD